MADVATAPLVHVRLLNYPLRLAERTQEHFEGVKREFALLAIGTSIDPGAHVATRLLEIADELSSYEGSPTANATRDAAQRRGDRTVDLDYDVPSDLAPHLLTFHNLL